MKKLFLGIIIASLAVAGTAFAQLTGTKAKLYDYWNNNAKEFCSVQQKDWETVRDIIQTIEDKGATPTEHMWFLLAGTRGELAECKGDYWLHFLITPN